MSKISVRELSSSEKKRFTGFDISIFQLWNIKEHGPDNLNKINPQLYNLMKRQMLIHSSYLEEDSYEGINNFNWYDIKNWNNLRNGSSFITNYPEYSNDKYNLKLGLVYKFILNDVCVCIDYTKHIINLQRKWRTYLSRVKHPKNIFNRCVTGKNIKFC